MIPVPLLFDKDPIYVQGMTNHESLDETGEGLVSFGAVPAAANSNLRANTMMVANARVNLAKPILVDSNFGRTVNVTAGGAASVTIFGRDYLNQFMSETVVHAGAGTIASKKAFKHVDALTSTGAVTVGLGRGPGLGLPFVALETIREYEDGLAATEGTLTVADTATPSLTTGDVRGTYAPGTTMNGANEIMVKMMFNHLAVDGLYGRPQA